MKRKTVIAVLAWTGTLAGAYIVGHVTAPVASVPGAVPSKAGSPSAFARPGGATAGQSVGAVTPEGLAGEAGSEKASGKRTQALLALLEGDRSAESWLRAMAEAMSYSPSQLEEALNGVMQLPPGRQRDRMILDMLTRWGQLDAAGALSYAGSIESLRLRNQAMGEVLQGWASRDPVSALGWLDEHGTEYSANTFGDYLADIMAGYAESNPQAAFDYVQALSSDTMADRRIKDRAMREVVDAMVEQGRLQEALDWTLSMEDASSRTSSLARLVDQWAAQDPAAAQAFVESMSGDPSYGELQQSLLRSWADSDPASAAAWISALDPASADVSRLATSLVFQWTNYDIAAAAEWLNTLPTTPELDRAVGVMAMRSAQDDPKAAWTWAESMSDGRMKDRLTFMIASSLNEQDPAALKELLDASEYSDDKKQQLLEAKAPEGGRFWGGGGGGPPPH